MALKLVTGPAVEPISLATAKVNLRVDVDDDDTFISGLIVTARRYVEAVSARALISQTWDYVLDDWPDSPFTIPRPPLQSITSIKYVDEDGVEGTVDSGDYVVDTFSEPGRVALASDASWPSDTLQPIAGVRIRFVAGFGDEAADVPETYTKAMDLLIGHWYENREAVATSGAVPKQLALAVDALLWLDRNVEF